jgi:hypothetical protein
MVTMSTLVFEVLWEALRLPWMPVLLAVDQHGVDEEERRRYVAKAEAELARSRLGTLREVNPELSDLLGILGRHGRGLGWRELSGRRRRAYVAARGSVAAGAVIDGEQVSLSGLHSDHMTSWLLNLLPAAKPGVGSAYSIPTDVYRQGVQLAVDGKGSVAQRTWLRSAGVRGDQANRLEVLTRTTLNTAAISVHRGKPGEAKLVGSLAYTDTTQGRYLLVQRPDSAGNSYTSIIPADPKVIRHHIVELMEPSC